MIKIINKAATIIVLLFVVYVLIFIVYDFQTWRIKLFEISNIEEKIGFLPYAIPFLIVTAICFFNKKKVFGIIIFSLITLFYFYLLRVYVYWSMECPCQGFFFGNLSPSIQLFFISIIWLFSVYIIIISFYGNNVLQKAKK